MLCENTSGYYLKEKKKVKTMSVSIYSFLTEFLSKILIYIFRDKFPGK